MRFVVIVALAIFWLFLAYQAFDRGNMALAGVFLLVGTVLTVYRLMRK